MAKNVERTPGEVPNLLIGCDPELFIMSGDRFVSAHDYLYGDKMMPAPVDKGAVQVDGVAAEFNIEPAKNAEEFLTNIMAVTSAMRDIVTSHDSELTLNAIPTATFDDDYWDRIPAENKELGCEPDFNAWRGGQENRKPNVNVKFRTGGGHIHLGFTENKDQTNIAHFNDCIQVTKQLDCALFIPSLLYDADQKRRELYGKMGAFRPKSFGVEYRPLSNAWMSDPELITWVFHNAAEAFHMLDAEDNRLYNESELQAIININEVAETGAMPSRQQVLEYHASLVELGFAPLPSRYLEAA